MSIPPFTSGRLGRDERGAILLMGLFMAVLLAGALFYVMGIGEAILQRERMQDAADAAAFNGAVLHASGMNLLVLINMLMAGLMAILVALKLAETLVMGMMLAIGIASFFAPGAAAILPELNTARAQISRAHGNAQKIIHPTLRALHATSVGVRNIVPWAAQLRVVEQSHSHYSPPAHGAVALPTRISLPVEDDDFARLCTEAGSYTAALVALPFDFIPDGGFLHDTMNGLIGSLTGAAPGWFCGDGKAPSPKVERREGFPAMPSRKACSEMRPGRDGYDVNEHQRVCEDAEAEEKAAGFDPNTGECTGDCKRGGAYDQRDAVARQQCDPARHKKRRSYLWQQRDAVYLVRGLEGGRASAPVLVSAGEPSLREGKRSPCGRQGAQVSSGWQAQQYDADHVLQPVCSDGDQIPRRMTTGQERRIARVEVTRMLACEQVSRERLQVDESTPETTSQERASMAPQKLVADAQMGSEAFQLRSLAVGSLPRQAPELALGVAAWGGKTKRATALSAARKLGHLAGAQAEYYFPGNDADGAMWEMKWTARLRRVRLPERTQKTANDGDAPTDGARTPAMDPAAAAEAFEFLEGLGESLGGGVSELMIH